MAELYPNYEIIKDIGSGINWKRSGFQRIITETLKGGVQEVVVSHRDRLCRFSFELVESIFKTCNTKLVVQNNEETKSDNEELAEDLLSIIHIFNCRQMGRRRYTNNKKDTNTTNKDTTTDTTQDVGDEQVVV
jgi:predicted site-specific integrase-resolvase